MNTHYSADLLRKCQERGEYPTTTAICAGLGAAVDAGIIELGELLDLVRSCSTADELGDALVMLAATVPASGISEHTLAVPTGGAQ